MQTANLQSISDVRTLVTIPNYSNQSCWTYQSPDSIHTLHPLFEHPDLVLSIQSLPQSKGLRGQVFFGDLDDEMSATDPEPVEEAQKSGETIASPSGVHDINILNSDIIMILTFRQNLDVPMTRPLKAYNKCSIFRSILESDVFQVLEGSNSPLAVVLPLYNPLESYRGCMKDKLSKWGMLFTCCLSTPQKSHAWLDGLAVPVREIESQPIFLVHDTVTLGRLDKLRVRVGHAKVANRDPL